MTMPVRDFCQVDDDAYQLTIVALGIQFTVTRLRRERGQLVGELHVGCDLAGAHTINGYLTVADFNLSSAQSRTARGKLLADRSAAPDIDWVGYLEELCVRTIEADRRGTPAVDLRTVAASGPAQVVDVDGWPWLRDHAMITFGDGGTCKSYLALYGAGLLARRGLRVGYADWELSEEEHRHRLGLLFGDALPQVQYWRLERPLVDVADWLRGEVRRLGVDHVVFDSAGFATAGAPESAEECLAYHRALRHIGVGSHSLAHVNRTENGDNKPFGSVFWHNSARSTWNIKLAETDGARVTIGLYNRKCNLGRLHPAVGFTLDFSDPACVPVISSDVADTPDLAAQLPLRQRIKNAVARTPCTLALLAKELEKSEDTVERTIRRHRDLFIRITGKDGIARIALVEKHRESA